MVLLLVCSIGMHATPGHTAEPELTSSCQAFLTAQQVQGLNSTLVELGKRSSCSFAGSDTDRSLTRTRWTAPDGAELTILVTAPGCLRRPGISGALFECHGPSAAAACPDVWRGLTKAAGVAAPNRAPTTSPSMLGAGAWFVIAIIGLLGILAATTRGPRRFWLMAASAASVIVVGIVAGPTAMTRLWFVVTAGLAGLTAFQASTVATPTNWQDVDPRSNPIDVVVLSLVFVAALAMRAWVEPGMSNWYTEMLPATYDADPEGRFGPGAQVAQSALAAFGLYSVETWRWVNVVLGAGGCVAAAAAAFELGWRRFGALSAGVLLAIAPLHVRTSASPSEHVLMALLLLTGFAVTTRAMRLKKPQLLLVGAMFMLAATLCRVDAFVQAALLALVAAVAHRDTLRSLAVPITACAVLATSMACLLYVTVVLPSNHPPPTSQQVLGAATGLLDHLRVAFEAPRWLSPVTLVLALVGLILLARRRWGFALVWVAAFCAAFIASGRLLAPDELLGGRYFIAHLAMLALPAGLALETAAAYVQARLPSLNHVAPAVLLVVVAATSLSLTAGALSTRYTFQAEHAFLETALDALPDGCVVLTPPVRGPALEGDMDCCLMPAASPLKVSHPTLNLHSAIVDSTLETYRDVDCLAFYAGAACRVADTRRITEARPEATALIRRLCTEFEAAGAAVGEPLSTATIIGHGQHDFWGGTNPTVSLWRLR